MSPASGLVQELFSKTVPIIPFSVFFILFGLFEVLIGLLFLKKGTERIVIPLLFLHMITTMGPLLFLPETTWIGFMTPTLEGQYIIKNLALIACAVGIAAKLHPIKNT